MIVVAIETGNARLESWWMYYGNEKPVQQSHSGRLSCSTTY